MTIENNENTNSQNGEEEVVIEEVEETEEETETEETTEEPSEKKPERVTETLEAREARLLRQLAQTQKKLGRTTEKKEVRSSNDSNDYGEKAFLIANGIKGADEISLAKKLAKETGKDLESLLETTYFQSELRDFREKKQTAIAIPSKSKRSNNTSTDSVEYWLAKDELPPASEVELRRKVVNARMKKEESKGVFYNS